MTRTVRGVSACAVCLVIIACSRNDEGREPPSSEVIDVAPGTPDEPGAVEPQPPATSGIVSRVAGQGLCSSDGWCWMNAAPHGDTLRALWASGPDDVWTASGLPSHRVNGGNTWLAHFDGRSWTGTSIDHEIRHLFGAAPDDIWGFGDVTVHWNGVAWNEVIGAPRNVSSVWGRAADDVYVLTGDEVFRWDGAGWNRVAVPIGAEVKHLWAGGPEDLWVGGSYGTLLHWDGAAWTGKRVTDSDLPNGPSATTRPEIIAIWGTASDDVWISRKWGSVEHWNGEEWKTELVDTWTEPVGDIEVGPHPTVAFSGRSSDDVWAIGRKPRHWDGAQWSEGFDSELPLLAGVALPDRDLFAGAGGALAELKGTTPRWITRPSRGKWGGLLALDSRHLWFDDRLSPAFPVHPSYPRRDLRMWNGRALSSIPELPRDDVIVIAALAPDDVWAAGPGGTLLRWDGASWSEDEQARKAVCPSLEPAGTCGFLAITRTPAGYRAFVARGFGFEHEIVALEGGYGTWSMLPAAIAVQTPWARVRAMPTGEVWALNAPEFGSISQWNGHSWDVHRPQSPAGSAVWVSGVWAAEGVTYVTGSSGAGTDLWSYDSGAWTKIETPGVESVSDVWASGRDDVWVVSTDHADVFHWDGSTWTREETGGSEGLRRVIGVDGALWVTGDHSVLRKRR